MAAAIIDRLIQLVKVRAEDHRRLFTDHIEPLFLDMAQVHAGYLKDFTTLDLMLLVNGDAALGSGAFRDEVNRLKIGQEHLRVTVHALLTAPRSHPCSELQDFFDKCKAYFDTAADSEPGIYRGYFSDILEELIRGDEPLSTGGFRDLLKHFLQQMRADWSAVTEAYAAARIALHK